jgi:hypothetical protein
MNKRKSLLLKPIALFPTQPSKVEELQSLLKRLDKGDRLNQDCEMLHFVTEDIRDIEEEKSCDDSWRKNRGVDSDR